MRGIRALGFGLVLAVAAVSTPPVSRAATVLVGNQVVEATVDEDAAGIAEAFRTSGTGTGAVATLTVYVDATSTATKIVAGIYADSGGHPGALLGQGALTSPTRGAWNIVSLAGGASVTAGATYWIAVLGPAGSGTLRFRDRTHAGGAAETSASTSLASLPASWATGTRYSDGPLSAYGSTADGPVLLATPSSLDFSALSEGGDPPGQTLSIANGGGGLLDWTAIPGAAWISVGQSSGVGAANVLVAASAAGLAVGTYTSSVTVSAAGAQGSPAVVPVRLIVTAPDVTPPSVAMTGPADGATVSGTVFLTAAATDDTAVASVQFVVDGTSVGPPDTAAPYAVSWDTTTAAPGPHTVGARATDVAGNARTSPSISVTVDNSAPPPTTFLVGNQQLEGNDDSDAAGTAEAFRTTAATTGTVTELTIYVNANSTATTLVAGLYANASGHPGALLSQGSLDAPRAGAWNTVRVAPGNVSAGATYWIAVLAPVGSGRLHFRDRVHAGGAAETSSGGSLSTLPGSWSTGATYGDGPLSAYGSGSLTVAPGLHVTPLALGFTARVGSADPAAEQLSVTASDTSSLAVAAASDATWLSVAPTNGTTPLTLTVAVSTGGLAVGSYSGHVTISSSGAQGSPALIPVTLTIVDPTPAPGDWLQIDHDSERTGDATAETALTATQARTLGLQWSTTLDGKVTAQPLYVRGVQVNGESHDMVIAASSGNSIYALDAATGAVLWQRNFGSSASNCAIPGGYGITGTPAVDRGASRVYTVADDGKLHALRLVDGADDVSALQLIALPATNKVWGGINVVGSQLYIATASDGCDSPPWRGQIYRVETAGVGLTLLDTFAVVPSIPAPDGGGGIWGYGGVSVDTATGGVFAATGADSNEEPTPYGNHMVALDASLDVLGAYEPPEPAQFPCSGAPCDLDFGSTPVIFHPSGCQTMTAAGNKNGYLYVFDTATLATSGQPRQALQLNPANDWLGSGGVGGVPAYWAAGRMLFVSDVGPGVPGVSGGIVGIAIRPDCTLQVVWSQTLGGATQPDSTPTVANGVVYVGVGNGGSVYAFDAATGEPLWNSGSAAAGAVYGAPTVADGRLFVGSWDGFTTSARGTIRAFAPVASGPSVTVTNPTDGATVSGAITVTAAASAVQGVAGVSFAVDGAPLGSQDTTSPYSAAWDTTTVAAGSHVVTATATDGSGRTSSASVSVTVANGPPPPPATTVLVGDQQIESNRDGNAAGSAEAFRTQATIGGTLSKLTVYVDANSTASTLVAGVYTDAGGHPGTLLGQGVASSPSAGAWNDVSLPAVQLTAGATYWIAIVGPTGSLAFRDRSGAGASESSAQASLSSLPATWTTGSVFRDGPLSAYGAGTTP